MTILSSAFRTLLNPLSSASRKSAKGVVRAGSVLGVALVVAVMAAGCASKQIPGTSLDDTDLNRAVVDFMDEYQRAVEARSAAAVLELVGPDYYEDMGTVDQDDDYGIEKLRSNLQKDLDQTKEVRLNVMVQHVEETESAGLVAVDYRYLQRALLGLPAGEKWVTHRDVNRIYLRKKGEMLEEGFYIVSGL